MTHIRYRKSYKYQLWETYTLQTPILTNRIVDTQFIRLDNKGLLTIRSGYAWNGADGPTVDTKDSMRGGLVHDSLCQLMREGLLDRSFHPMVDCILKDILLEDKMNPDRAEIWYWGVKNLGGFASDPKHDRPVLTAP